MNCKIDSNEIRIKHGEKVKKIMILGTGTKAFHVFNTCFRDRGEFEVVCFTTQVISEKKLYPPLLAGKLYPHGIPIIYEKKFR